jgi:hypothetical protein
MQNITSSKELKEAIQLLEVEQAANGQLFKEEFLITLESLKPIKLIEGTLKEIISSPYVTNNFLGTGIGLAAGYLSKKIIVGGSGNILRKLFGSFLQLGVTNLISQHPGAVKSFGMYVIEQIFSKKEGAQEQNE